MWRARGRCSIRRCASARTSTSSGGCTRGAGGAAMTPEVGSHTTNPPPRGGLLARRFRYGTSAAALALRHPTSVPPLVLHPWPALTVAGLLARRPLVAAAAFGVANLAMIRTLRKADVPSPGVPGAMLMAVHQTWLGTGRCGTQFPPPPRVGLMAGPGRNATGPPVARASLHR